MIIPDFRQIQRNSLELYHYGIKRRSGRYPWGSGNKPYQSEVTKRNFQDPIKDRPGDISQLKTITDRIRSSSGKGSVVYKDSKDSIIKKDTTMSRLSLSENENVPNVRKYVSISEIPEETWMRIMKDGYSKMGYEYLYSKKYQAIRDIKVASVDTAKANFDKWFKDHESALNINLPIIIEDWSRNTGGIKTGDKKEDFFKQLGMRNIVNQSYLDYMKSKGYDALQDVYGIQTGGDKSIIILDPDNTLNLKEQYRIKI